MSSFVLNETKPTWGSSLAQDGTSPVRISLIVHRPDTFGWYMRVLGLKISTCLGVGIVILCLKKFSDQMKDYNKE